MNLRGQTIFLAFMLAIVFFFLGLMIAPVLIHSVGAGRDVMDCNNSSITTSQKINCTAYDLVAPYIIGLLFAFGGGLIGSKIT